MNEKDFKKAVEDVKDVAGDVKEALVDKVEDVKEGVKEVKDEIVKVANAEGADAVMAAIEGSQDSLDEKAEVLCRWAAGRAAVIVVAPLLGTVALMANEMYLINKLAKLYDKKISERAAMSFLGAFSGTLAGNLLATLIPFGPVQIPIAVGVTYAIGKVAHAWIKEDMPSDMEPFKEMFKEWKEKAKQEVKVLAEDPLKNIPLGDETKDYLRESGSRLSEAIDDMKDKAKVALDSSKENLQDTKEVLTERAAMSANTLKEKAHEGSDALKEKATTSADALKYKGKGVALSTATLLGTIAEKLGEFAESSKKKLEELDDKEEMSKLEKLIDDTKELATEFKDTAMDKLEDLADKAEDLMEDVKDKAEDAFDKAKDKAEDVKEKVEDKAKEVKDELKK